MGKATNFPKEVRSELLFHNGVFASIEGDTKKAIKCFEASLQENPGNNNAQNALKQIKENIKK